MVSKRDNIRIHQDKSYGTNAIKAERTQRSNLVLFHLEEQFIAKGRLIMTNLIRIIEN
ncbi:hypothetical protein AXFE_19080 [Acidithrix ferrooxidans]|uniref:Uncharacterized protein n=1 Tax=Acidithrix ferrooxidans TaxID=1280514 RepID=A0A0D8HGS2_9ACTN|nr:hypothetical protein P405_02 [uncultured Acidithrix sp.]KJF17195.1 hypothetical protein AXFE_19080 [Acidithrix ferrooxidans]